MKVLVLCGGATAERIVSLASGDAVAQWVSEAGHVAVKYDPEAPRVVVPSAVKMAPEAIGLAAPAPLAADGFDPQIVRALLDTIERERPDIVFPILHGGYGEDGTVQALLDWCNVRYAGSGALASALAMDKQQARLLMQQAGVRVARGFAVPPERMEDAAFVAQFIAQTCGFPVVVKPLHGGSTVGLEKVYAAPDLAAALAAVRQQRDTALVEELFAGREITVTVVNGEPFPIVEIRPKTGFYDYANKYTAGRTDYICPAEIPDAVTQNVQAAAVAAFHALGCRGCVRVDFLLNDHDEFVCLELNTQPGMTLHSLVPKASRARGIQPPALMQLILDAAP